MGSRKQGFSNNWAVFCEDAQMAPKFVKVHGSSVCEHHCKPQASRNSWQTYSSTSSCQYSSVLAMNTSLQALLSVNEKQREEHGCFQSCLGLWGRAQQDQAWKQPPGYLILHGLAWLTQAWLLATVQQQPFHQQDTMSFTLRSMRPRFESPACHWCSMGKLGPITHSQPASQGCCKDNMDEKRII